MQQLERELNGYVDWICKAGKDWVCKAGVRQVGKYEAGADWVCKAGVRQV